MLCAISGEAPQVPVASRKSGTVFEKRLIEAYINENGKDPVTGEDLSIDDLVELKSTRYVKPRPPTLTSIPSLLSVFQNEWDALALETFTLKQQLAQLRQELSTALYNNDAAVRVIARLSKERDEARDALSRVSLQDRRTAAVPHTNGGDDSMQVDGEVMSDELKAKVDSTQERLSRTRRKRPVPEGWATSDTLQSLDFSGRSKPLDTSVSSLAIGGDSRTAILGGIDGATCTFAVIPQEVLQLTQGDGTPVTAAIAWEQNNVLKPIIATENGEIAVLENGQRVTSFASHSGPATAIALHPSGDILGSVGLDKSFVFYDLSNMKVISQVFTDSELTCCQFHPDGHIFAAGSRNGQIKIFETKTMASAATFNAPGSVQSLSFSENGIWLASVAQGSSSVIVWDLRKGTQLISLEFESRIDCVRFDYTGQFLAGAGPGGVVVQAYDRGSKTWSEPLKKACSALAVEWGHQATSLIVLTTDGYLTVLQ